MNRMLFKNRLITICVLFLLFKINVVYNIEELFFNNDLNLFNSFLDNHVKIEDLKINSGYLFKPPENVNIDLALSALNGSAKNEVEQNTVNEKTNRGIYNSDNYTTGDNNNNNNNNNFDFEIKEWKMLTKDDFYYFKNNTKNEDLIKGLPESYSINNINENMENLKFYFNDISKNYVREIIYNRNYIPDIYNNIFYIFLIIFMYCFGFNILVQGYLNKKQVAKNYIPKVSTLLIFFLLLKILIQILPVMLCCIICLILTFYFHSISMESCSNLFYFLKRSKISKEPIGWIIIVYAESLLIGNIIYHFLLTPNLLKLLMIKYIKNYILLNITCLLILICISSLIYCLMIGNIFTPKIAQDFVFSFISSYLILSFITYCYNLFVFRILNYTHYIFQIEPIMFFSNFPKFVFNLENITALVILFLMISLSFALPKLSKIYFNLSKKKKKRRKHIEKTASNKYDILLGYFI
ncbi:conserved membrane protein, unknown function [Hepatocystis sp. ex Piliocolobus tephrosceles]|nr:conserved membrane protein, unknown function [Hepatocystis sp. ex Piliocolobus tephrosceles]